MDGLESTSSAEGGGRVLCKIENTGNHIFSRAFLTGFET
jgi:hypothetical protein